MADNFSPDLISDNSQKSFDIKEFILKYLKYLPWIIICGIIGFIAGYIKLRYAVPQYKAEASMLIRNNALNGGGNDSKMGALLMQQGSNINLANEMQILQARPLLKRVAQNLKLHTRYYAVGNVKSTLYYKNNPVKLTILALDSLSNATPFGFEVQVVNADAFIINNDTRRFYFNQPFVYNGSHLELIKTDSIVKNSNNEYPKIFITYTPSQFVADQLKSALAIKVVEGTDVLKLSAFGENKDMCADILTGVMAVYDSMGIEERSRVAQITLQFIDDRLDTVKKELGNVENRLQDFMEKNKLYDMEAQSSNYLELYNDYYKRESQMVVQTSILNWLIDYLKNKQNKNRLVPTTLGVPEPALGGFIEGYNKLQIERDATIKTVPESNPMIQKMDVSLEKMRVDMIEALTNVKASYNLTDQSLKSNSQNAQNELLSLPQKGRQMIEIKRMQQIMQDLYSFLLQKKIEVSISSASNISIARVVEEAVPSGAPVSPNRKSIYLMFTMLGLAIPIGIAALLELLNDRVNSKADIQKLTQTPILGEVGHSEPEDLPLVMKNNSRKFIAEQFRIIRTNLQFILANVNKPVIIVTSTFSGEGKSFVSTNLGGVMALAKKKTLIMEFDIRKPKVASGLGIHVRKGITNFIVGNVSLDDLIVPVDDIPDLYLLPCGPVPPNPAELLLSPAIKELFEYARKNFDAIIVDTAPVGVVSDALILGGLADGAVYIIRQGYTYKKQVAFIEDMYSQQKLPRQSIIINDIKHVMGYGGYYGYGYGYASGKKSHYFDEQKKSLFSGLFRKKKRKK
ncbi:GumC family protein [Pinibacter soli]|uniref:Polysaccharide biosynthesis tyrosine autokinase n=1 Tax=Pinibacter soli TaxID=3044211 RepID=A0ABT6R896_9BACT|nr:tyrosine-protein kinase [Pinibacter soli]MDI3318645.1 polysaccharide biosynthesis tyrosine autokinase [Pinibacter soli]